MDSINPTRPEPQTDARGIRAILIRAEGQELSRVQVRNCNRTP